MPNNELTRSDRNTNSPRSLWRAWDNFAQDFDSFFEDFDRVLGINTLGTASGDRDRRGLTFAPPIDVEETQNGYDLSFDIPGFKTDDIDLELNGRTLTVTAKRERSNTDSKVHRSERYYGEYRRSITLPENVKADQIQAKYESGVLTVSLPKAQLAQSKKIEIGTSANRNESALGSTKNVRTQAKEKNTQAQDVTH